MALGIVTGKIIYAQLKVSPIICVEPGEVYVNKIPLIGKEIQSKTLIKVVKMDFIQILLQLGKKRLQYVTELNSEYKLGK